MSNNGGFYEAYVEHSRVLRTWLVAYGIGAPVLLLTNERIATTLSASGRGREIALCFLVGVALQVLLAAVNKTAMWMLHCGEDAEAFRKKRRYKLADWISEQFWIDLGADIGAMALFAHATYGAFNVVVT